ncbi:hypothetical protein KOR42_36880 [Thalassoglobus neptunius]|uniref:Metallophosphoesterase YhaO n=2 Tax=Thalassoglobus neptunius TaxID=1938619 RepID=A0A5C5WGT5_9PLAN|nr:hypothetical protein KOR42_36880 [Thalassoglobus neptunius]
MVGEVRRILQASHFRLDESLHGDFSRVSDGHKSTIIDARFAAAEKVFRTAIDRDVDLLILSGELGSTNVNPRIGWFLIEQINRLREHNIRVALLNTVPVDECWTALFAQNGIDLSSSMSRLADHDPTLRIKLIHSGHGPASIKYRRRGQEQSLVVPTCEIQASTFVDQGPFEVKLIHLDHSSAHVVDSISVESVRFRSLQISAPDSLSQLGSVDSIASEIIRQTTSDSTATIPTVVDIELDSLPRSLSAVSRTRLLNDIQQQLNARVPAIAVSRLVVDWNSSTLSEAASDALEIAKRELSRIELTDVNGSLTSGPQAVCENQFNRIKQRVAHCLPAVLESSTVPSLDNFLV